VDFSSVYPTLCELTGLPLPDHLDGRSIVPLLKDPTSEWVLPAITTHGFKNHAVRSERWRYIHYANGDEELYDTAADPLEYSNLAERPEQATRKGELAKWLPQTDAPHLVGRGKDQKNNKAPR
jgi:arylsulfatase A-like enzyme